MLENVKLKIKHILLQKDKEIGCYNNMNFSIKIWKPIPYFTGYKTGFPFPNNNPIYQDQTDQSYKTDPDFRDCFGQEKKILCDLNIYNLLTHSYLETCKRVIGKQSRHRSDAT